LSSAEIIAALAANAIAYAKIQQGTALSVLGVTGNATANLADIVAGSDGNVLRRSGTAVGFGAIDASSANAITNQLRAACVPALTGAIQTAGGVLATTETIDLVFIIGDGTNVIATGIAGNWSAPLDFACTIVAWSIVAKQSGSISVDLLKTTFSNFDS